MSFEDYRRMYDGIHGMQGQAASGPNPLNGFQAKMDLWVEAGYRPGQTILDYGCGAGLALNWISDPSTYLGVDMSPNALRLVQESFPAARVQTLAYPGTLNVGEFDFVAASSVFTHTPHEFVPACLRDIHRALRGVGIIDVIFGEDDPNNGFVRQFSPTTWKESLDAADLKGEYLEQVAWAGDDTTYTHDYFRVSRVRRIGVVGQT